MSIPQHRTGRFFVDLDGTLLDRRSYRPSEAALAEVRELVAVGLLVIPATSKSLAETASLAVTVGLGHHAIAESGGVIVDGTGSTVLVGTSRASLVKVLEVLQRRGWPIRGMSQMTAAEVVQRTGLEKGAAERAMARVASEPFVFTEAPDGPIDALVSEGASLGAGIERGGRFHHLLGRGVCKGSAVSRILASPTVESAGFSAAVGDAWNDLSMLAQVEHGFLLGSAVADDLAPPGVVRLAEDGPEGFVLAARQVRRLLASGGRGDRGGTA